VLRVLTWITRSFVNKAKEGGHIRMYDIHCLSEGVLQGQSNYVLEMHHAHLI